MPKIRDDITGQRFGKWTVLGSQTKRYVKTGEIIYSCRCDCGTVKNVRAYELVTGRSKSCGCALLKNSAELAIKEKSQVYLVDGTDLSMLNSSTPKNNTSGRRGVWYWGKRGKWVAYITFKRKRHTLGYFDSFEEAVKAREAGELEYFDPVLELYKERLTKQHN